MRLMSAVGLASLFSVIFSLAGVVRAGDAQVYEIPKLSNIVTDGKADDAQSVCPCRLEMEREALCLRSLPANALRLANTADFVLLPLAAGRQDSGSIEAKVELRQSESVALPSV